LGLRSDPQTYHSQYRHQQYELHSQPLQNKFTENTDWKDSSGKPEFVQNKGRNRMNFYSHALFFYTKYSMSASGDHKAFCVTRIIAIDKKK
jgi:hypothetical protein